MAPALQQVGTALYAARPTVQSAKSAHAPCAVMVYGWMDAELKYVSKYVQPYMELYPHATVLVQLSTTSSAFMTTPPGGEPDTLAALELLREAHDRAHAVSPEVRPTVVFHSFSNGGLMPFTSLLDYGCRTPERLPRPLAYIMDCSPGYLDGKLFAEAMAPMAPTGSYLGQFQHWMMRNSSRAVFDGINAYAWLRRRENPLEVAKHYVNDVASWAWGERPAQLPARLYTFTEADAFIAPDAVIAHAQEAQDTMRHEPVRVHDLEKLAPEEVRLTEDTVQLCRWTTPKHCAIARHAPGTYWAAIRQFLETAVAHNAAPMAKY